MRFSNRIIILISLIGLAVSLYLYLLHIGVIGEVYCPIGGCEAVMVSKWSMLFNVPVALWGMFYYIMLICAIAVKNFNEKFIINLGILGILVFGILFTIYLRFVELFYVHEVCMWCWVSVLCIAGIFLIYLVNRKYYFPNGNENESRK